MHLQELAPEIVEQVLVQQFFTHGHLFCMPSNDMLDSFCRLPGPTPCYSSILPLDFVNVAPCALTTKTKSNQSQGLEPTLFKGPCLCTDGRVETEASNLHFQTMPHHLPSRVKTRQCRWCEGRVFETNLQAQLKPSGRLQPVALTG